MGPHLIRRFRQANVPAVAANYRPKLPSWATSRCICRRIRRRDTTSRRGTSHRFDAGEKYTSSNAAYPFAWAPPTRRGAFSDGGMSTRVALAADGVVPVLRRNNLEKYDGELKPTLYPMVLISTVGSLSRRLAQA